MATTPDPFGAWLAQAQIPDTRLTPEQRSLLQYVFRFRQQKGTDYLTFRTPETRLFSENIKPEQASDIAQSPIDTPLSQLPKLPKWLGFGKPGKLQPCFRGAEREEVARLLGSQTEV